MPEPNLFEVFTGPLNELGIRYMVTGAVASIIYGEPRVTNDIDVVIEIPAHRVEDIIRAFPLSDFYCPPVEVIKLEAGRSVRGHFNIIHHETGLKADFYMMGQDELHHWAMPNRKRIELEGTHFWVAPPEYVILRKLEYFKEGGSDKHLRDISTMIEVSGDQLDLKEIQERAEKYGLAKEWKQLRKSIRGLED
jgi:hypothetical protein